MPRAVDRTNAESKSVRVTRPTIRLPSIAGTASAPTSASRGITVATGVIADWRANGAIAPHYKAVAVAIMLASFSASMAMDLAGNIVASAWRTLASFRPFKSFVGDRPNRTRQADRPYELGYPLEKEVLP